MTNSDFGKVVCSSTGCFQWHIENFLGKAWYQDNGISSPKFSFSGHTYNLFICVSRSENLLKLYFVMGRDSPSHKLYVKIGMRTGPRGRIETRSGEMEGKRNQGTSVWMHCSELMERRCDIMPDGRLTVFCELKRLDIEEDLPLLQGISSSEEIREDKIVGEEIREDKIVGEDIREDKKASDSNSSDDEVSVSEYKILKKMQRDFKNLFLSADNCDITIKVQEKEFRAHTIILRTRSPVFRSMFSHEMAETLSGEVVIDDCDPGTFPDFLNYLYTGSTKHISDENVCHLYTVSDKYQVEELKEECATFMKSNLSVATFCDVLTVAVRHTERELIDLSTEFFCDNASEIGKTANWQTFLRENPTVANELFLKALSRGKTA